MESDLVCAECGSNDISVECVVQQDADGELVIRSICDDGHSCNVCGSDHITDRINPSAAMKEIQHLLDRTEWNAETAESIAQIVRRTGLAVREPMVDEPDDEDVDPVLSVDTTRCPIIHWCTLPEAHQGPCRDVQGAHFVDATYGAAPGGA
jgi:hypothetical protein